MSSFEQTKLTPTTDTNEHGPTCAAADLVCPSAQVSDLHGRPRGAFSAAAGLCPLAQATALSPGVCKTVGVAYVGSNPTPATSKTQFRHGEARSWPLAEGAVCKTAGQAVLTKS